MATIFEGTWEEIKSHDNELTGRNVRLIVEPGSQTDASELPFPANSISSQEHLEALLLEGLESGPMTPMTAEDWADVRREGHALAVQSRNRSKNDA